MNDQRIVDYLRTRASVDLPLDLVGSISGMVSEAPQQRRVWFAAYIPAAAAVGVLAVVVAVSLILQSPTGPSPSPSPSAPASPTVAPSASPSSTVFVPDYNSFAEVAVPSLALYSEQDRSSPTIGEAITGATGEGQLVYVTDRPADPGWRRIEVRVSVEGASGWVFAWAPLEVDGQSTLRPAHLAGCPSRVDVAALAAMTPPEHLLCFGSRSLELSGSAQPQRVDFGFGLTGEAGWLADAPDLGLLSGSPQTAGPTVAVHLDPAPGGAFPIGEDVVVSAHFNDPRSATCRRTGLPAPASETPQESALWCAQQLVIEEVRRAGPPIPTPPPVIYRADAGSPFTIIDSAAADALFGQVDTCTNPVGRFTVTFPATWYTNPTVAGLPACSWFAPTPFTISSTSTVPDEVAMVVTVHQGSVGYFNAPETTLQEQISIGGHDGGRMEQVGMTYEGAGFERLPPSYVYTVDFGGLAGNGPTAQAIADSVGAADYVLNKAVLDRIMASLVYVGP